MTFVNAKSENSTRCFPAVGQFYQHAYDVRLASRPRESKPYGDKGLGRFSKKRGDGVILLQPRQIGETNIIGAFVPLCR